MESKPTPIKVAFIGDSSVGKTSIVSRIAINAFFDFTESTIGAAFRTFSAPGNSKQQYHVWDTAGQERYNGLIPMYLRGASIIVVVFDITRRESFERVHDHWLPYVRAQLRTTVPSPDVLICLLGNKQDLHNMRTVSTEEAQKCADLYGATYIEVSAKSGVGATEIVTAFGKHENQNSVGVGIGLGDGVVSLSKPPSSSGGGCCFGYGGWW